MRNIPDFGQFKTVYGLRLFGDFLQASHSEMTISLPLLQSLHSVTLQAMSEDGNLPEGYRIADGDHSYTRDELFELFNKNLEALRLHVVRSFEDFFAQGTEPAHFVARYHQGEAEARRALAYATLFPVEATSVRTEMHHPSYARRMAMSDDIGLILTRIFADEKGNAFPISYIEGPVSPRIPTTRSIQFIEKTWPDLDRRIARGEAFEALAPTKFN